MKNLKSTLTMGAILPAALFAQERPNIIYIMTDQQTATAMSCAGNMYVNTPSWPLTVYVSPTPIAHFP